MNINKIRLFAIAAFATIALSACELETHDNGKLDGFWQMSQIDTLATGGTKDVSQDRLYWSVQAQLIELSDRSSTDNAKYIFRFSNRSDSLLLRDGRLSDRRKGDPALESAEPLHQYGVNELDEKFAIEALSGSRMILKSETLRIKLRKF